MDMEPVLLARPQRDRSRRPLLRALQSTRKAKGKKGKKGSKNPPQQQQGNAGEGRDSREVFLCGGRKLRLDSDRAAAQAVLQADCVGVEDLGNGQKSSVYIQDLPIGLVAMDLKEKAWRRCQLARNRDEGGVGDDEPSEAEEGDEGETDDGGAKQEADSNASGDVAGDGGDGDPLASVDIDPEVRSLLPYSYQDDTLAQVFVLGQSLAAAAVTGQNLDDLTSVPCLGASPEMISALEDELKVKSNSMDDFSLCLRIPMPEALHRGNMGRHGAGVATIDDLSEDQLTDALQRIRVAARIVVLARLSELGGLSTAGDSNAGTGPGSTDGDGDVDMTSGGTAAGTATGATDDAAGEVKEDPSTITQTSHFRVSFGGARNVLNALAAKGRTKDNGAGTINELHQELSEYLAAETSLRPTKAKKGLADPMPVQIEFGVRYAYISASAVSCTQRKEEIPVSDEVKELQRSHWCLLAHFDEAFLKRGNKMAMYKETVWNIQQKCMHLVPRIDIRMDELYHIALNPSLVQPLRPGDTVQQARDPDEILRQLLEVLEIVAALPGIADIHLARRVTWKLVPRTQADPQRSAEENRIRDFGAAFVDEVRFATEYWQSGHPDQALANVALLNAEAHGSKPGRLRVCIKTKLYARNIVRTQIMVQELTVRGIHSATSPSGQLLFPGGTEMVGGSSDNAIFVSPVIAPNYGYICVGEKRRGVGGLPTALAHTVVALLSGGIDSPVAAQLMMKRGCRVVLVHFQNSMQLDQNGEAIKDKIVQLADHLSRFQNKTTLYMIPFANLQQVIIDRVPAGERMLVYRRFMMMIASKIAAKYRAPFLVTGDSMSQVASQTIRNLEAVYRSTETPILAPLIGMNKNEIIRIAEDIGTFEISQLPYGDCCSYFLAKHPSLHLREPLGARKLLASVAKQFGSEAQRLVKDVILQAQVSEWSRPGAQVIKQQFSDLALETQVKAGDVCIIESDMPVGASAANSAAAVQELDGDGDVVLEGAPDSAASSGGLSMAPPVPKKRKGDHSDDVRGALTAVDSLVAASASTVSGAYLDNAASTKMDPEVVRAMIPLFLDSYGNPNSPHGAGRNAAEFVSAAREFLARSINASRATEIIFTGSGTEANNMAIFGVVEAAAAALAPSHGGSADLCVLTTAIEHDSIKQTCELLSKRLAPYGNRVTVTTAVVECALVTGMVTPDKLRRAIAQQQQAGKRVVLVTLGQGNNEIGTIQDLAGLGAVIAEANAVNLDADTSPANASHKTFFPRIYFHVDACQSFTKTELDVQAAHVDFCALNAHKIHGPKGVGALYLRASTQGWIQPLLIGGGHEFGLRSSTVNAAGIVGFHRAAELALQDLSAKQERMAKLCQKLFDGIKERVDPDVKLNGPELGSDERLCYHLSVLFAKFEGDNMMSFLSRYGVYCSTGSACSSEDMEPSHVLVAIGRKAQQALRSVRFGVSRFTTEDEIEEALKRLAQFASERA